MSLDVGADTVVAQALEATVLLVTALGRMREAARLLGATSRIEDEMGSVRDRATAELLDGAVQSIRASLGDGATSDEIQLGRELPLEEAAEFALGAMGDPEVGPDRLPAGP
jgi:hypothetical protein